MLYIKQIMELFNVREGIANKICAEMECSDFDFSESSDLDFQIQAQLAFRAVADNYR